MLWGVVMGSPLCCNASLTPPLFGGASPLITSPTLSHWFPVHWYVSGISVCYVGISLLLKGLGLFPPSVGGFRGHQHLRCPYAYSCTFFVVLMSHVLTMASTTTSSGYGGIFWLVFSVISDSGSFPDRVSSKLGSAWHGSTTNQPPIILYLINAWCPFWCLLFTFRC